MPKIIAPFLILVLIISVLSDSVTIFVIGAIIGIILYTIIKLISVLKQKEEDKRKLLLQQQSFLRELAKYTGKNVVLTNTSVELEELIKLEFDNFISSRSVPAPIVSTFHSLKDQLERLNSSCITWLSEYVPCDAYYISGASLNRKKIESSSCEIIVSSLFQSIEHFLLRIDEKFYLFCLYFIIVVDSDKVNFYEWKDFSLGMPSTITVEEDQFISIPGIEPIDYRYLHERVDGGPDRRYNYNPATPVYEYSILDWVLISKSKLIISCNSIATDLWNSLNNFKSHLTANPVSLRKNIHETDLTKDEIANLFKEIISQFGREIIGKQLFISLLEHYHITKKNEAIKPIIRQLVKQNLIQQLSDSSCTYDTLNRVKVQIKHSLHIEYSKIDETFAYLGYGLQLI